MIESKENRQHLLFALLLGIAGLLIILIFVTLRSQADTNNTPTSSADITNEAPSVTIGTISATQAGLAITSLTPTENSTANEIWITGSYTDNNGCKEVDYWNGLGGNIEARFYRTDVTGGTSCSANANSCYSYESTYSQWNGTTIGFEGGCTVSCAGGTATNGTYECALRNLAYIMDPTDSGTHSLTDWTVEVIATDPSLATGNATSAIEVNSLTALDLPSSAIAYGAVALGAQSSEVALSVANTGNTTMGVQASGTDMTCTTGVIDKTRQRFASTTSAFLDKTIMSDIPATVTAFSVAVGTGTDGMNATVNGSNNNMYWQIELPSTGLAGSCTGTNTLSAIAT